MELVRQIYLSVQANTSWEFHKESTWIQLKPRKINAKSRCGVCRCNKRTLEALNSAIKIL